jgi:transposase
VPGKPKKGSPIADEILRRIASLYAIEKEIRGQSPRHRHAARQTWSRPIVEALHVWIGEQRARLSGKSPIGQALAYITNHCNGFASSSTAVCF